MIQITVNGESVEIDAPMTVEQLLDTVDVPPNYLAVEVNADVVPRERYTQMMVDAGDDVEVVTLVGGGWPIPNCYAFPYFGFRDCLPPPSLPMISPLLLEDTHSTAV